MQLSKIFHAVKSGNAAEKVAFWQLCKTAATKNGDPVPLGLTKIAFEIWADAFESGLRPKLAKREREAFASSFGSAAAVENEFAKWAASGEISEDEHLKLANWLAESAVNDLVELTKSADFNRFIRRPQVVGTLAGGALGAGLGAATDEDNRLRGAAIGFLPGALTGLTLGAGYDEYASDQAGSVAHQLRQAAADRAALEDKSGRGRAALDALRVVAKRDSQGTDVLKYVDQNADRLKQHFAEGHSHIPEDMHNLIKDPQDRIDFMSAVNRILRPGVKKSANLQKKIADLMQGLDQGGQAPMPAEAVPAGVQMPQGEAIAEPNTGDSEAMANADKGHRVVDNMIFLANQVQLPQLAQEMTQNRDMLASHFADGNAYIPAELQHHFTQSEHAEAFMKKYKQRFGSPANGGKKTASARAFQHDWLSWRTHR